MTMITMIMTMDTITIISSREAESADFSAAIRPADAEKGRKSAS